MPAAHLRLRSFFVFVCSFVFVVSAHAATLTELVPEAAPRGARLLVTGNGLAAADTTVVFTGAGGIDVAATVVERNDGYVEVIVPGSAVTGAVRVMSGASPAGTLSFTLAPDAAFVKVATLVADFREPAGTCALMPDGSAYVVDNARHQIRLLRADGTTAMTIGSGRGGFDDGGAASAAFKAPTAIALDRVRGVLYVADTGNHAIRQVTLDGTVTTLAGSGHGGDIDGPVGAAQFRSPAGLAVDGAGTLYVADAGNHKIRIIAGGVVSTLAGTGAEGEADGHGRDSLFRGPEGVAVGPDGTIWVADSRNHRIRMIVNGIVSTVAGTGRGGHVDGPGATAELRDPGALVVDDSGDVFFADRANAAVRRLTITGAGITVSTLAGGGNGFTDGAPAVARFHQPVGLAFSGALLVADLRNGALRAMYQEPSAVAIYPRNGLVSGGNTIRLFGTGFVAGATTVRIGTATADVIYRSSTELSVVVPASVLGTADVVVTTPAGSVTLPGGYRYVEPPSIASIDPGKGMTGGAQLVTITGTNFETDTVVRFGAVSAAVTFLSSTSLQVTTPPLSAGAYDVTVSTAGGEATLPAAFIAFPPPVISGFTPAAGVAGTAVTISGSGFDPEVTGNIVRFGTFIASVTGATSTQLLAVVPAQFVSGRISVTTAGGVATSATDFVIGNFTSIAVEPAPFSLSIGGTQQLAAYGVSADGSRQNLTTAVTWSTSRPSVATVDAGLVRAVADGSATITASFGGLTGNATVTVLDDTLPPDPASIAPDIDASRSTGFAERNEFLYSGPTPIQIGVAPGTIQATRAVVLRGSVRGRDGAPLSRVRVSIAAHPELGFTFTRADGAFDLAVNGGGMMSVLFQRDGLISASRDVATVWQDFMNLEPVVMIEYDTAVTQVSFGTAAPVQVARGSAVSDESGSRQPLVVVPTGTTAWLVRADGTSVSVSTLNIRATEYTVGSSGPQAMPATLPPQSGYTYCVELSADEAVAAGATSVTFGKRLGYYVENFLNFPVGGRVPLGYFDRVKQIWVPSDDGKIVRIVSVTNGIADVDSTGDGVAEPVTTLNNIGITEAERTALAGAYAVGTSLWRLSIGHFTPWDANWPYGPPPDATPPGVPDPETTSEEVDDSACASGSIIDCENQTLRENIPIANTPFTLNYGSDRAPQKKSATLAIKLTKATYPASLKRIELEISVAGREFTYSFSPSPNLTHTFVWDGHDAYGRIVQSAVPAKVRIGHTYDGVYHEPATFGLAFSGMSGIPITGNRTRREITLWQEATRDLVYWVYDARERGVGGWTLDVHHAYNFYGTTLFRGDGRRMSAEGLGHIVKSIAGIGCTGYDCPNVLGADGGPAATTQIRYPDHLEIGPDGSLYFTERINHRAVRITPAGIFEVVAGTGVPGYSGDGGPAKLAKLTAPESIRVAKDGTLYIGDSGNRAIRKVTPDGKIQTMTASTFSFDGAAALAFGPDGSLYVGNYRQVRRYTPDGRETHFAGNSACCTIYTTPGPATQRDIGFVHGLAVAKDGTVYIADGNNSRIHRVGTDGIMSIFAGINSTQSGYNGDGIPATQAQLRVPASVAVDKDDNVYIADYYNYRVRKVNAAGTISTIAGNGVYGYSGESGPPNAAMLSVPGGVAISPLGTVYIADHFNARIRTVGKPLPGFGTDQFFVPSPDGGEAYIFDESGRHLRTIDPQFNTTIYTFGYDANGRLTSVTDHLNKQTVIERNAAGEPTAIVSSHGERTTLVTGTDGYLSSISNPSGSYSFTYGATGKMTKLVDARQFEHNFTYDLDGALIRDDQPTGSFKILTASGSRASRSVTLTTKGGKVTTYVRNRFADSSSQKVTVDPNGRTVNTSVGADRKSRVTTPDGLTMDVTLAPDPVMGMITPFANSTVVATPGGRSFTMTLERQAELTDSANPLSLKKRTDKVTIGSRVWTDTFDAVAKTFTQLSAGGRVATVSFDSFGRRLSSQYGGTAATTFSYDADGNLAGAARGPRSVTYGYDGKGRLSSITDAASRTTSFEYDAAGRLNKQLLPGGRSIGFTWDAAGNLTSVSPPSRPAYHFTYTAGDVPGSAQMAAEEGATSFLYDEDDQLSLITRPDGTTIDYGYDHGGRLTSITTPSGSYTTAYGALGAVSSVTSPDGVHVAYTYDGPLLLSEIWSGAITGTVTRTYGTDTRLSSENGVAITVDADDFLMQAGALTLQRDAQTGALAGTTLGGVSDSWGYNQLGEVTSYSASFNGTPLLSLSYTRDNAGRITAIGSQGFEYDHSGRLERVTSSGSPVAEYTYDANGNRTGHAWIGGSNTATYDAQDRLVEYGSTTYAYSANGELKSKTLAGSTTTFDYDALGNLRKTVLPGGRTIEYVIDGLNRRVGKKIDGTRVRGWLYADQLRVAAELDGSNTVVSRFVYGSRSNVPDYMIRGGVTYRIISDHLGSPRLVVNTATGAIAQAMTFDEFGRVLSDTAPGFQPFGFAGGLYDSETGLVRFGSRDYSAAEGRWTTRDPILFAGGDTNLYGYTWNDPINWIDPTGMNAFCTLPGRIPPFFRLPSQVARAQQARGMPRPTPAPRLRPATMNRKGQPPNPGSPPTEPTPVRNPTKMQRLVKFTKEATEGIDEASSFLEGFANWMGGVFPFLVRPADVREQMEREAAQPADWCGCST